MSKQQTQTTTMSTKTTNTKTETKMENRLEQLKKRMEEKGTIRRENRGGTRESLSLKQKVITSIKNEIAVLERRDNLELKYTAKDKHGNPTKLENRFWKPSKENPNEVGICVKVGGRRFNLLAIEETTHNPGYLFVEKDKDVVLDILNDLLEYANAMDEKNPVFVAHQEKLDESAKRSAERKRERDALKYAG